MRSIKELREENRMARARLALVLMARAIRLAGGIFNE